MNTTVAGLTVFPFRFKFWFRYRFRLLKVLLVSSSGLLHMEAGPTQHRYISPTLPTDGRVWLWFAINRLGVAIFILIKFIRLVIYYDHQ